MNMMRVDLVLCIENAFKNGELFVFCLFDPMEHYFFYILWLLICFGLTRNGFDHWNVTFVWRPTFCVVDALNI